LQRQLRFGIICGGASLQQWQIRCVKALLDLGGAKLALIITVPKKRVGMTEARFSDLLFVSYRKVFVRPRAQEPQSIAGLFPDVPRLDCQTLSRAESSERFRDEDVETIGRYNLDFALGFGDRTPTGKVLTSTRYGVWSFWHGDVDNQQRCPPGFWEIYYRHPVTGAALQRIAEGPDSLVLLRKGYFRTQLSSYSRNLQLVLTEISRWPAQVCRDILNNEAGYLMSSPTRTGGSSFSPPTNRETILFLGRILVARLKSTYRLFFRYSFWNIGVVEAPIERFLNNDYRPKIDWLPRPPKGEFKADPFGMLASSNLHVFYENLDYHHPKGIIFTVDVQTSGTFATRPRKMIELPVHMSYPFLVKHGGEIYCIPETCRAREISVYKAVHFPYEWKKQGALLTNVMAIDTTIFQHEEFWWMMFTDRQRGGDANLYVWYAPDFWGPWKPHLNNPVKSDVRSARPGGTTFYHDGFLYRPAQDCSSTGGGRIVINRIRRLTPTQFEEEPVATVEPDRKGSYPEGLHTLSQVGNFTLVDGKRFEFSVHGLLNNILKGIRRTLDHE
jgi:hypothetical protein